MVINGNKEEMNQKSTGVAYLLLILPSFFFICGIHRFYIGKVGTGIIYLLTFGLLRIGLIYDLFTLPNQVRMANLLRGGAVAQTQNNHQSQNVVVNINPSDFNSSQPQKAENKS
jgi:TM2 domain-containing membrane protein YozV